MAKIAKRNPFGGSPVIHTPNLFGASTGKEFIYRIPVTGKRPISITVSGLKEGIKQNNNILYGKIDCDCIFDIVINAENDVSKTEKVMTIEIGYDKPQLTPLMGFTSWNAYGAQVTQDDLISVGNDMLENGIADYGYNYVNLDSGWQNAYGGKYDAIMPNDRFPNMNNMCSKLHNMGYKCGIYSTPMLTAWGCPEDMESIPGCTRGEPDYLCTCTNGGVGVEHLEENNVKQWEEWGFDYLKYDWDLPDPQNADLMKKALLKSRRDFTYCITVSAHPSFALYWSKYVNSWRNNADSEPVWENVKNRLSTVIYWKPYVCKGHFYDLDMLELGRSQFGKDVQGLSEDEKVFAFTMRAFFMSPIQISTQISELDDFELDILCNDEIIALNQDTAFDYPTLMEDYESRTDLKAYYRRLENGDEAIAVFNLSDSKQKDYISFENTKKVRDVWAKENLGEFSILNYQVPAHGVRVFRVQYL